MYAQLFAFLDEELPKHEVENGSPILQAQSHFRRLLLEHVQATFEARSKVTDAELAIKSYKQAHREGTPVRSMLTH